MSIRVVLVAACLSIAATKACGYGEVDSSFNPAPVPGIICAAGGAMTTFDDGYAFRVGSDGFRTFIVKTLPDGNVDPRFGTQGVAVAPYVGTLLLPTFDGGVLSVDSKLTRYTSSGVLDPRFGRNGSVNSIDAAFPRSAALQPDGSVVILYFDSNGMYSLRRFNASGAPDASIGDAGKMALPLGSEAIVYGWALLGDGSVEVGSYVHDLSGTMHPQLRHYTAGTTMSDRIVDRLVPQRGVAGWTSPRVKVDAQGRVVIADYPANFSNREIRVTRFLRGGDRDPQFGADGVTQISPFNFDDPGSSYGVTPIATAIWSAPGGSYTVLMYVQVSAGGFRPPLLVDTRALRLTASGTLEPGFQLASLGGWQFSQFSMLDDGSMLTASSSTSCVLQKQRGDSERVDATAVEYYAPSLDHYFFALDGLETGILDNTPQGWSRTGYTFGGWRAVDLPGAVKMCRFYGDLTAGPNSHFYTPEGDECESLRRLEAQTPLGQPAWRFEGYAMTVAVPDAEGRCAPNLTPVYRAYNRGFEKGGVPNHRYVTDVPLYQQMQDKGWAPEGVRFCVPPPSSRETRGGE